MTPTSPIYADKLSALAVLKFFTLARSRRLQVLNNFNAVQRLMAAVLNAIGFDIRELNFHASTVVDQDGETIFFKARRDSGPLSIDIARDVVNSSAALTIINDYYGTDNIVLNIARKICLPIEVVLKQAFVARFHRDNHDVTFICAKPSVFAPEKLKLHVDSVDWVFYGHSVQLWRVLQHATTALMRGIWHSVKPYLKKPRYSVNMDNSKPSVLLLEEDDPHYSLDKRSMFDWHIGQENINFNTVLWRHLNQNTTITDIEKMNERDIFALEMSQFATFSPTARVTPKLKQIRAHQWRLIFEIFHSSPQKFWMMINVIFLLGLTKKVICATDRLNIKAVLIKEFYFNHSDACIMASALSDISVFGRQYSSLMMKSPIMMGNCHSFFMFSDHFRTTFSLADPPSYTPIVAGYPTTHNNTTLRTRANAQRQRFAKAGVSFVIGGFDEAIEYNKWGLISPQAHIRELEELLQFIEANPETGVAVKTQFMSSLPSKVYPDNKLIKRLMKTGQYIELAQGSHRNIISPAEAALSSDICIGHKFGATASLEAALCGTRSLLLDPFAGKSLQDKIYQQAEIVYPSMASAVAAIQHLRANPVSTIGDWSNIIDQLSSQDDRSSLIVDTLNSTVARSG
ncbi:MAG: hypothetical protein J4F41_04305 [Alphaproteobacteria bacterium]|nr:hypothetical protein [Alphaproteobacteria bacterium]